MIYSSSNNHYRAVWLSDCHLGTKGCKAPWLLDFLKSHQSNYLYLVGDFIDGWQLKRRWYWDPYHDGIIQTILEKAQNGTQVIYIPGNHDEFLRAFIGHCVSGVTILDQDVFTTADGRRFLVIHGDQYDGVIQYAPALAFLGDIVYTNLLILNRIFNRFRSCLGYRYWSLSGYLKYKAKSAVNFISAFEQTLAQEALRQGMDGVICGHIHHPEIRSIGNILYCNDGDWVESCTCLVEDLDGHLRLIKWSQDNLQGRSQKFRTIPFSVPGLKPQQSLK